MFQGQRFVTRGVLNSVPIGIQAFLWSLIDNLVSQHQVELDYLQVFELKSANGNGQKIIHRQEVPAYWAEYVFDNVKKPLIVKLYVIDDGTYCTMCLPEER